MNKIKNHQPRNVSKILSLWQTCPMPSRKKKLTPKQLDELINSIQAKFRYKPGEKPFAEEWAEYKREERELEERKFQRHMALGKNSSLTRLRSKLNRIKRTGFTK
jgi:hypothetical protein